MAAMAVQTTRAARHWVKGLLVAALIGGSLGGAALAVDMLRGNGPRAASTALNVAVVHSIGEDVATSFGVVAVKHAVATSGLDAQQVGAADGSPGLFEAGTIDIQVSAVITNLTDNVLAYRPTQFELIDKAGAAIPLARVSQVPGELQPFATIDVHIDFVTTTDVRPFKVRFTDPATNEAMLIDLGALGCATSCSSP